MRNHQSPVINVARLALVIALAAIINASGRAVTLVRDGHPASMIVLPANAQDSQRLAAQEFQEHIRLISGAELPIAAETELPKDGAALILVGQGKLAKAHGVDTSRLEPETFVVKTDGDVLILAGEDGGSRSDPRTGTLWAVYDFLQDQLGCRWLWPGDIGRVTPHQGTVAVDKLDIQETPQIKVRGFRMVTQEKHREMYAQEGIGAFLDLGAVFDQLSEDERTWLRRMRMGRSFKVSYGHAFTDWWERYKDSDPEIFALQPNGRREPLRSSKPDFVKMCVSNPRLWELQLAPLRERAANGATGQWLNACENDGSGGFCVCPRCRAWDAGGTATGPSAEDGSEIDGGPGAAPLPESLSDRYAHWYNELAVRLREFDPEGRVIAYAYSAYRSPPVSVPRIEPNVWIGYVGFNAYPRPEDYRANAAAEWLGWSRLGATVFLRSNSLFYYGEGAPLVASHQIAADFKLQAANGLRATDYDCLQGNWATSGPGYYVLARLLWDTEAGAGTLLDEYYGAFGPASAAVQSYFEYWEDFTERLGNDPAYFALNRTEKLQAYPRLYTAETFAAAEALLSRADAEAKDAPAETRERLRNLRLGLEHGRLLCAALRDGNTASGPEGEALMALRRDIAPRNVVNVYWTTYKEKRYRVRE